MKKLVRMQRLIYIFRLLVFGFLLWVNSGSLMGQQLKVWAKLDTSRILLGDQTHLTIELTAPNGMKCNFPIINDTLTTQVEVVDRTSIDTVVRTGSNYTLQQVFKITSFEVGQHLIPPFGFDLQQGGEQSKMESNSLNLEVVSFKVDTAAQSIADIKAPLQTPFTFNEFLHLYWPYLLAAIILIAGIVFYFYYMKRKQQNKPVLNIRKPKQPPHLTAYDRLEELKEKKLWQQDKFKEYHSELTDILRTYIEERYTIQALEMTSDELMDSIGRSGLIDSITVEKLQQVLRLADMAKFAKAKPLPEENERSLSNTYSIIDTTKYISPVNDDDPKEDEVNGNEEVAENLGPK